MEVSVLGMSPEGCVITAATDMAGPQVIAVTPDRKINLLSRPLVDHQAAVELGKRVVAEGTGVYEEWFDLNNSNLFDQLFAVFGGPFR